MRRPGLALLLRLAKQWRAGRNRDDAAKNSVACRRRRRAPATPAAATYNKPGLMLFVRGAAGAIRTAPRVLAAFGEGICLNARQKLKLARSS